MTDIAGRVAFITGGANGIGLGIARSLAKAGAKIALADVDTTGLARAAAELGDTKVFTAVLDVRDRDAYARVADAAEGELGPVSILVNNAGVAGGVNAADMTYEMWDWGIGINLHGVINGVQTFLPRIARRGEGGHIVNTASGAGLVPPDRGGRVLYATAKYAVVGMSESLGAELEPQGIGVTVLCPGPVATGIVARSNAASPSARAFETRSDVQRELIRRTEAYLAAGKSPDEVGDMVRDAIRAHRLYVHTDRAALERIEARCAALLAAMPPA